MANIPIRDIPGAVVASPDPSNLIPMDNGSLMQKTTIANAVNTVLPLASQATAEAGDNNSDRMSSLRTKQAIDAQTPAIINTAITALNLGTMSQETASDYTKTSGLAAVALSNNYADLSNRPTLGTAAATNASDYATAAQGALASSAVQPGNAALVPSGGTIGQVLVKNSGTNYDTGWVSSAAATAVSYAPQTLTDAQAGQARANIDAGVLAGFRNKIINGSAQFIQRGSRTITAGNSAYVLDRFLITNNTNQTVSVSQHNLGVGSGFALDARYVMRMAFSAAPTTGTIRVEQRIEFVDTVSPGDATFIAWMAGPSGAESLNAELVQNFGTGGSPSAQVVTPMIFAGGSPTTIYSSSTNRRAWGVTVPSLAGKLIGSNNNDYIAPAIIMTPRQSGNYDVTWLSFVEGDATAEDDPFSPRHIQQELALCQRYYQRVELFYGGTSYFKYAPAGGVSWFNSSQGLPTSMRSSPTVAITTAPTYTNCSTLIVSAYPDAVVSTVTASAAGPYRATGAEVSLDAEL